jgi:hypothetical protein
MVHSVTIQPGNVNAYREKRDHINGVAVYGSLIAIEYTSDSRRGDRGIIVGHLEANKSWHSCLSTKKPTPVPCWHLGALRLSGGWSVPKRIDLELEMLELEDYAWKNATSKYVSRQHGTLEFSVLTQKNQGQRKEQSLKKAAQVLFCLPPKIAGCLNTNFPKRC